MTIISNNKSITECVLRLPEVMKRTGLARSSIYLHISENNFPKQINLGVRSVGWLESEINGWIAKRITSSRQHIPKPT
jgi:prophage regulatory protein